MLVPLHDPTRYCWLPQFTLSQALQTPGLLPDRQWLVLQATLEKGSHLYPLDVPLQLPVRCWPVGHVVLLQAEHAVLEAPEHPALWYWPDAHVSQAPQEKLFVSPKHFTCVTYLLSPQVCSGDAWQVYPSLVPEHLPTLYWPRPHPFA